MEEVFKELLNNLFNGKQLNTNYQHHQRQGSVCAVAALKTMDCLKKSELVVIF
jgi:mRNA-degrading endonuclease YafQ of YafQ-DinJ toxin-antitoxin module